MVQIVGKDTSKLRRATCTYCASILEFSRAEVSQYFSTDYLGCTETYYYIKCPCCGNKVHVPLYG